MAIPLILHLVSVVIWVGGMFFAYQCLRPVAAQLLTPETRLPLWNEVFSRFFFWVWLAVIAIVVSGHWMIGVYGGMASVGKHVHIMLGLGYLMVAIYMHVYFALYRKFQKLVVNEDWQEAGAKLNKIRKWVGINLLLGLVLVGIASGGRYLLS